MTLQSAGGLYPCAKGCGGFGVHVCGDVNSVFRSPSTTGYPESSGPCGRCGAPTYIGITHHCATVQFPPAPIFEPTKPLPWPPQFEVFQPLYHNVPDASGACTPPCPACAAGVPLQREPVRWKPKRCGKCQSQDGRIYFHVGSYNTSGSDKPGCGRGDLAQADRQHLHVYCQVCHFDWTERLPRKS